MDSSGSIYIANSWSVGGRTRHVDECNYFLQELKDQGLLIIQHVPGDSNGIDIFMKNVTSAVFNRHVPPYVGLDEYVTVHDQASSGEAVSDQNLLKLGAEEVSNVLGHARPSQDLTPRQSE